MQVIIAERVKKVIACNLKDDKFKFFQNEARLEEDLKMDSFDQVEMLIALEDEFDIEVLVEGSEKMVTVEDVIKHVEKALAAAH